MRMMRRTPIMCKGDIVIPEYGVMTDALVYLRLEADMYINYIKYKRCISMMKYCDMGLTYYNEKLDSFSCQRADFFYKWYNIWYKLAYKFKECF